MNANVELLELIQKYCIKPGIFESGEKHFWDDPHISKMMLEAHLNQFHNAASRKYETIDKTIANLLESGILKPGMKLLDLGCGPGLYAERLARAGIEVVGVDISENSLAYAREAAAQAGLSIEYICKNFFDIDYETEFDAVIQVYGELCVFSDEALEKLLISINKALKKNGVFISDFSTRAGRLKNPPRRDWQISEGGFWNPGRHLVLQMTFDYPERDIWLDQFIIADEQGCKVYRNWFHDYSLSSIKKVIEAKGFETVHVWNDLTGEEYSSGGDWIAIAARKTQEVPDK